jgi:polyhydroxyalkanoate synthesis regulator phasin
MEFVVERTFVTAENKGFPKGTVIKDQLSQDVIEKLVEQGILSVVEPMKAFVDKVNRKSKKEAEEVEKLDPENQTRSK